MKKPAKKDSTKTPVSKKRSGKYDEKLQINGSFEELVKELITPNKKDKNVGN